MKLFQAYLPLLVFAGIFHDSAASDKELAGKSFDVVRKDIAALLQQASKACADIPERDQQEALFAACAFVDEALLTSQWQEKALWQRATLQQTYFSTVNAGIEFYDHLRTLLNLKQEDQDDAADDEVIELGDPLPEYSLQPEKASVASRLKQMLGIRSRKPAGSTGGSRLQSSSAPWTTALLEDSSISQTDVSQNEDGSPWKEDILAVYGACLLMGFKGRYYDSAKKEALLAMTRASLEKAVGSRVAPGQRLFSPESYYMPEAAGPKRYMPMYARVILAVVPLFLTIALFMAYSHTLSAFASHWIQALGG